MTIPMPTRDLDCSERTDTWLRSFDETLHRYYGISREDTGADSQVFERYRELSGDEAAMEFAADHDLDRIDWWTWSKLGT